MGKDDGAAVDRKAETEELVEILSAENTALPLLVV